MRIVQLTENLIRKDIKTVVQARYGFHQIKEAIDFYLKNQTAGKVLLKPSLTKADAQVPSAKL